MAQMVQGLRVNHKATQFVHKSVLADELMSRLEIQPGGHYLDVTVGAGGHSGLILAAAPDVRVTAIDRDEMAIAVAKNNLAEYANQVEFWHGNFAEYDYSSEQFDGIIADLGVNSGHLEIAERGFSFRKSGPLDMRMDSRQSLTAAEIVNQWDEKQIADIFYHYGEERLSRQIARRIVQRRPFTTTTQLAETIAKHMPRRYRRSRTHPATRFFQALRIAVNQELESLETFLAQAPKALKVGGHIGVISFHSLEDRIVKHKLRESPLLETITKKPVRPKEAELAQNPRSRSAKLRIARAI